LLLFLVALTPTTAATMAITTTIIAEHTISHILLDQFLGFQRESDEDGYPYSWLYAMAALGFTAKERELREKGERRQHTSSQL
jgi:hypothetical protein